MATYNGEKYIQEQISSILAQISKDDELIISDDYSNDNTINVIKSFKDKRINLIENNKNIGYAANFERALQKATGDVIFLADQDDIWLDNKVKISLKYLSKYDFVISDAKIIDDRAALINKSRNKKYQVKKGFMQNWLRSRYIGCCMAFDRQVLDSLFPFPKNKKWIPHDLWIALIAELYYKTFLISEPLILYRRHANNASNGGGVSQRALIIKMISRVYTLENVLRQYKVVRNVKNKAKRK